MVIRFKVKLNADSVTEIRFELIENFCKLCNGKFDKRFMLLLSNESSANTSRPSKTFASIEVIRLFAYKAFLIWVKIEKYHLVISLSN